MDCASASRRSLAGQNSSKRFGAHVGRSAVRVEPDAQRAAIVTPSQRRADQSAGERDDSTSLRPRVTLELGLRKNCTGGFERCAHAQHGGSGGVEQRSTADLAQRAVAPERHQRLAQTAPARCPIAVARDLGLDALAQCASAVFLVRARRDTVDGPRSVRDRCGRRVGELPHEGAVRREQQATEQEQDRRDCSHDPVSVRRRSGVMAAHSPVQRSALGPGHATSSAASSERRLHVEQRIVRSRAISACWGQALEVSLLARGALAALPSTERGQPRKATGPTNQAPWTSTAVDRRTHITG